MVNKFTWIFYWSNILRIVNMVFEVDKYHNWSNTLTRQVRVNTLFFRQIQPSTHSSSFLAICAIVEVLNNEVQLNPDWHDYIVLQATTVHVLIKSWNRVVVHVPNKRSELHFNISYKSTTVWCFQLNVTFIVYIKVSSSMVHGFARRQISVRQ